MFEPEVGAFERNVHSLSETEYTDMFKADQQKQRPISEEYQGHTQLNGYRGDDKASSDILPGTDRYQSPLNTYKPSNSLSHNIHPQTVNDKRSYLISKYFYGQRPGAFPSQPVHLNPEDEMLLRDVVAVEVEGFSRHRIDAIKMDAIIADREVNSTCAASTLEKIFKEHGVSGTAQFLDNKQNKEKWAKMHAPTR